MLFNSYVFILLFLPIVLILYYLVNETGKYIAGKAVLITASLFFIAYLNIYYAIVFLMSTCINIFFNSYIAKEKDGSKRKHLTILGIIVNIVFLGLFKYANYIFTLIGLSFPDAVLLKEGILLPLGISFYTFSQISFLVDSYNREISHFNLFDYLLYISFFPKLTEGPIAYYAELEHQFNDPAKKAIKAENISRGLYLFAIGLFKKVLIADKFGIIVDYGYSHIPSLNSFEALLAIAGYTLQIYFDFSGYCDIAMGTAYMLNIELPQNFNSPYKALNINEFWKRWHITLTRFLTKYIYIPLGGNRKGTKRTYINILIVFLVSGLWHGAGITFVIWGLMHGIASVLYRCFSNRYDHIPKLLRWLLTFVFVNIAWVFFRAKTAVDGVLILSRIFSGNLQLTINPELAEDLLQPTFVNALSQVLTLRVTVILLFILARPSSPPELHLQTETRPSLKQTRPSPLPTCSSC